MWGIIATWEMAKEGVNLGAKSLKKKKHVFDAIEECVQYVEDRPEYTSVGYGGLPNERGVVELDASFMDGDTLSIGAVASIKDFRYPSSIARSLMKGNVNNLLVGQGAEDYAATAGFERRTMLTKESHARWVEHKKSVELDNLNPYIGHDTVCSVGLDQSGRMATCTSTSGLFFKKAGRVGDSPIPGGGYYVDSEYGGACATGLGEDIMKGATCFKIVDLMRQGKSPQEACEIAVLDLHERLTKKRGKAGDISVIAMNPKGAYGAATNIDAFPFIVATSKEDVTVYVARFDGKRFSTEKK